MSSEQLTRRVGQSSRETSPVASRGAGVPPANLSPMKISNGKVSVASVLVLSVAVVALGDASGAAAGESADRPPACEEARPPEPGAPPAPPEVQTSMTTVGQAYYCILDKYVDGATLNTRVLLADAFAGFTSELDRARLDRSAATMPALTGDRDGDWAAFSEAYQRVLDELPDDADLRQALAASAITAMVEGLHDNHSRWKPRESNTMYTFGLSVSDLTSPEVFVTAVEDGPAAANDVRPGDIIKSVNGYPLFVNGQLAEGVADWLLAPSGERVTLELTRPSTGRTRTVAMTPEEATLDPGGKVTATRVAGDLAHVTFTGFAPGVADDIRQAIVDLQDDGPLSGVVLDVRRNSGGSAKEVGRLLGFFVHGTAYGYFCDGNYENCEPKYPDDTAGLLDLPLALLTSRGCPSACDSLAAAVRDLELGPLVGTRTAGKISGGSLPCVLDDGSQMTLPLQRGLGPDGEIINEIGVAPDHYIPQTARDLSTKHDPALAKAAALLHG